MKPILIIAFRNLFRQKSRSILLGLGIGLGIMVLTVGFSFSKGISRNAIDKIVQANVFGHLGIYMVEKEGKTSRRVIRDKEEMISKIYERLDDVKEVREALTIGLYAIGNGSQMPMGLSGVDLSDPHLLNACHLVSGSFDDFTNHTIENPLILSIQGAKSLNVAVGDKIRIRTRTIYGQIQTAELILVAIFEYEAPIINAFFQGGVPLADFKKLMGYQSHETAFLNIVMEDMGDTGNILSLADLLQKRLTPEPVSVTGSFQVGEDTPEGILFGIQSGKDTFEVMKKEMSVIKGDLASFYERTGAILLNKSLSTQLNTEPGMTVDFYYKPKFEDKPIKISFKVGAVIEDLGETSANVAYINDMDFYETYFEHLPGKQEVSVTASALSEDNAVSSIYSQSWKLAQRTYSADAMYKKRREIRRANYQGRILDVMSMKEPAESLYQSEAAINILTLFGMVIVFSIILVGVLNTLRMNIRERTREIGTVRAIGMQRKQVLYTLITEVGLLSVISSILGVIAGFISMNLLSRLTFHPVAMDFSVALDNGHIKFIPNMEAIVVCAIIIILATMVTAYFPARRASKMTVASALGHHE